MKDIYTGLDLHGNVVDNSPSTNQVTIFTGDEADLLSKPFKPLIWINPDEEDEEATSGAKTYTAHLQGNDTDNFFTVTHNLGTTDVTITVIDQDGDLCLFDIEIIDENSLKLKTQAPIPVTDEFDVTIIG